MGLTVGDVVAGDRKATQVAIPATWFRDGRGIWGNNHGEESKLLDPQRDCDNRAGQHDLSESAIKEFLTAQFPHLGGFPSAARAFGFGSPAFTGGMVLSPRAGWFDAELTIYMRPGTALTRGRMRSLAFTAFGTMGLVRVTAEIAADNLVSRRFVERIGFVYEGRKRQGYDGKRDAIIYGLTKADFWARFGAYTNKG